MNEQNSDNFNATSNIEPTPTVEPTSTMEQTPVVESTTVVEPTPVVESTTVVEPTPAVEEENNTYNSKKFNTPHNKRNKMFLSLVGTATLVVAIIGATMAWFSATVTGNDTASSVKVSTATLGIVYTNTDLVSLNGAMPGTSDTQTFTVAAASTATTDQKYSLSWAITSNNFVGTDLVYTLTATKTGTGTVITKTETTMPTTSATIASTGIVKVGETHTYTLTVTFKETGVNQNSNQGKTFGGKIQVAGINVSSGSV